MKKIITLGGSNSKNSISKQLAEYSATLLNKVEVKNIDLNDYELPLYSVDIQAENGIPNKVEELSKIIENSGGIIICLAEHNGAYSVAFKNVFDWLSVLDGKVWKNKPMLLLATSPGERGGQSVLEIAKNRFPYNGGNILSAFAFPSFNANFKDGKVVNSTLNNKLEVLAKQLEESL